MWYLTLFPEGATEYYSNSMRDWVSVDHQVEHQRGKVGEVSCGPGIDQDVAIWSTQQKGLHVTRLPRRVHCRARSAGSATSTRRSTAGSTAEPRPRTTGG